MELLTNSFEENPRRAPVPKLFTGNPVFSSVPEVSLVFSPPSKNVESRSIRSASSNEMIVTNIPSDEERDLVASPKSILTNFSSTSVVRNVRKIPQNNYIEIPPFKEISNNEAKFLESVGVMADKILEENALLSQQHQLNRQHPRITSEDKRRGDGANVLMGLQLPNNHRNPLPTSHQCYSQVTARVDSNCQVNGAMRGNFSYRNSVERETHGYPVENNCDIETEAVFTNKIPITHCANMIPMNVNASRKSCVCAENIPHYIGGTCNVQSKITPSDNCLCSTKNTAQGFCNLLYEKNRPCCCDKSSVQVCTTAMPYSNNSNSSMLVPPVPFSSKSTIPENLEVINHCRSNSSDDTYRNVHTVSESQVSSMYNEKTDYSARQPCTRRPTAFDSNKKSDRTADTEAHQMNSRQTNTGRKLNRLETLEEKCEEEVMNDSMKRGEVGERKENNKNPANTTLLQEIVEINQKQCNFIQGLLQQVVALQADQMKILGQISEKLNGVLTLDENSKKCSDISKTCSVKNATTQTNLTEKPYMQYRHCQQVEDKSLTHDKISKKSEIDRCACKRSATDVASGTQSAPVQCEVITTPEIDPNRGKKLQDRAVSWSAVHGVETVEESFTLHGVCVPTVVEQMPSSVHTMHLHMQDYHSSASFESISDSRSGTESKFQESSLDNRGSWTLYDNIVDHVKKFLHKPCEKSAPNVQQKSSQVEAIRFATIEKIRQLGVSVYENSTEIKEVSTTGRIHFDSKVAHCPSIQYSHCAEHNSSDASLEIQTLALKYLPEDDLYDIAKLNHGKRNLSSKAGQKSANVSIATQNYLEKYNLLPSCAEDKNKLQIFSNQNPIGLSNNILDITTLKKQPKLL